MVVWGARERRPYRKDFIDKRYHLQDAKLYLNSVW